MRRTIFQRKCDPTTRIRIERVLFDDRDLIDQHLRRLFFRVVVRECAEVAEARERLAAASRMRPRSSSSRTHQTNGLANAVRRRAI